MPIAILVLAGFSACGAILFIALKDLPRILRLAKYGKRTNGKIVRDHTMIATGGIIHFPVIHFKDDSGFIHEFESRYPKKSSLSDHMSEVIVAYDPKNPKNGVVLEARHFYPSIIQVLVFLAIPAGITALMLLLAK